MHWHFVRRRRRWQSPESRAEQERWAALQLHLRAKKIEAIGVLNQRERSAGAFYCCFYIIFAHNTHSHTHTRIRNTITECTHSFFLSFFVFVYSTRGYRFSVYVLFRPRFWHPECISFFFLPFPRNCLVFNRRLHFGMRHKLATQHTQVPRTHTTQAFVSLGVRKAKNEKQSADYPRRCTFGLKNSFLFISEVEKHRC